MKITSKRLQLLSSGIMSNWSSASQTFVSHVRAWTRTVWTVY